MEKKSFNSHAPGDLVKIPSGGYAFVPDPLPPDWSIPLDLWPLLCEVKQQVGILEGLGRNLPNPAILLRPIRDREAIQSSRLEGTYATPKELLLFELRPRPSKSESDPANDQREVLNYRFALEEGTTSPLPLSLRLIRNLHRNLLAEVRGRDRDPGEFRKIQVAIGSSHRFVPPPPERLLDCLGRLETYLHAKTSIDPLVDCFLVHYQFEAIHPFIDGNGRVGRLLLAIMLQQRCVLTKPWLYMSEFYEENRDEYIQRLFDVSAKNDWSGWIEFCLRGVLQQTLDTIERCGRLLQLRTEFMQRVADVGGSVRLHQIVENIFNSPFVEVTGVRDLLNVSYPTAQADVDRLVKAKILRLLPNVSQKTYFAPEIFDIAYDKMDAANE